MDLEKQLNKHLEDLLQAKTKEEKYFHWEQLKALHYQRMPDRVRIMEYEMGLL